MSEREKRDAKILPEELIKVALGKWELKGVEVTKIEPKEISDPLRFVLSMNSISHQNATHLKEELEGFIGYTANFEGNNLVVEYTGKK